MPITYSGTERPYAPLLEPFSLSLYVFFYDIDNFLFAFTGYSKHVKKGASLTGVVAF